jgi:hypothetical protein
MAFRVSLVFALVVFAGAGVYVVHDRSTLARRIHARELSYTSCARAAKKTLVAQECGWKELADARRGDLYGLPFLALALALSLLLIYKVRVAPDPRPPSGYVRADDPVI